MTAEVASSEASATDPAPAAPAPVRLSRRERWTPILLSILSTVVVGGLLAWWIGSSEQWPVVQRQFFSGEAMVEAFPAVLEGFWINMRVWVIAEILILVVSLVLAVMRSLTGPLFAPLRVFAIAYIDFLRGVPALLLILLLGFGVPALQLPGLPNGALFWGTVALVAGYSAYTAEVYRAGMDSVHDGQRAAAKALGLDQWQTMRYAVIPQAIRNVAPALLNGLVSLQKDVALLSVIGIRDAVREAQIIKDRTFNYSSFIVAAILFLIASVPLARFADWYARRDAERRLQRTA
ncbi:amino acid ABC transporter permease [Euzebya tangerina]|uniref:amino acid ABC transporter permease n=1 Tax=Euzebya tangerina TaxID=591198 RepID=UPI000E313F89|nr:amino acid ABC transporter permease [Euzebya tangerina]